MTALDLDLISKELDKKTAPQLIDILSFTQDDYQPEVIPIIENILIGRGVDRIEIEKYKHSYSKLKASIDKQNYSPKYKTPVIVTIIILCIGSYIWRTSINNAFNKPRVEANEEWTSAYTRYY